MQETDVFLKGMSVFGIRNRRKKPEFRMAELRQNDQIAV